ncbi:hypothetical protein R6Z02_12980 [Carnobacterium maltaromaticum]|uniref:hypothetical protein n=1 Tax=Carnobacterium maltaromaticum TaxID=2751 RepID=UPI00298B2F0B|nr:hypothetical protein [Carnobacterium maltaromaticum]MDW5524666.1 hypothetical protein [Carnobacterium maltaromaticum]
MLFYDFEVFKHDWLVVIVNTETKTEVVIENDLEKFIDFYNENKNNIWVGYNSRHYDQYIVKGIVCGFTPQEVNDWIIMQRKPGWQFSRAFFKVKFYNFDIMNGFHSLKQLEAFMGHDIRETTVPFDIDRKLIRKELNEVIFYCRHDVNETIEVFMNRIEEFQSHLQLINEFELPLKYISKTQAQLSSIILGANKVKNIEADELDMLFPETMRITKYKSVVDFYKENEDKGRKLVIEICGVKHVFAWGGVHGAEDNVNITCADDEYLIMADVDQLYPTIMVKYNLLSRAVSNPSIFQNILDTSLRLKKEKKKKEREPFKRICNITYGAEGDQFNNMYDPRNRKLVCIFGQLLLLDLIEQSEEIKSLKLIQSNTDGVLIKIKKTDFDLLDDILFEWEERTGLNMSVDFYKTIIQKDVNNYILVDHDGNYKSKGAYVKKLDNLDYDLPIVNKAVVDYLVHGIPVSVTISKCNELREFQKVIKISNKYEYAILGNKKQSEKVFRLFASNDKNDKQLRKVKDGSPSKIAYTPDICFIDNTDVTTKKVPAKLDKVWYIEMAKKRINDFLGK